VSRHHQLSPAFPPSFSVFVSLSIVSAAVFVYFLFRDFVYVFVSLFLSIFVFFYIFLFEIIVVAALVSGGRRISGW
jgi:hypothetical protein